jgi:hypothetical protein
MTTGKDRLLIADVATMEVNSRSCDVRKLLFRNPGLLTKENRLFCHGAIALEFVCELPQFNRRSAQNYAAFNPLKLYFQRTVVCLLLGT